MRLQTRTDDVRAILRLLQQLRGHDDIGVDGPQWNLQFLSRSASPSFGFAHRILIADDQCGLHFVAEPQQAVPGKAAQHESDIFPGKVGGDIGNTLDKKTVVPQIRIRIKRHRS